MGKIVEKNAALVPFFDFRKILWKISSTFAADLQIAGPMLDSKIAFLLSM